ncbi:Polyketide synthase enoylreductase [Penicillium cf. griseofulvum]|nr:Polyketide synthase enoylreductase [Penicillium cf. griseofulvum]
MASNQASSNQAPSNQAPSNQAASDQNAFQDDSNQLAPGQPASDQFSFDQVGASDQLASGQGAFHQGIPEQLASDQLASDRLASDRLASDQLASDQLASDQLASDQLASGRGAFHQGTSNLSASDQLAFDQLAYGQFASDQAPNQAAWLIAKSAHPLMVGAAPYTPPSANQIVIKNAAVAVNPVEWAKQLMGNMILPWVKYPFVLGNDCAGQVVQVGDMVSHIKVGDRVLAHAVSMDPAVNKSSEGAFQRYTVIRSNMVTVIPDWLSYEEACVVPLGLSTAATALFDSDFLFLNRPGAPLGRSPLPQVVLVWGGSTSVGCNAIQLAASAGYEVVTTCSPKNFEYVTNLGATAVFDYRSELTIAQIVYLLKNKKVVGAVAIGKDSTEACIKILAKTNGSKFVAQAGLPYPETIPTTKFQLFRALTASMWSNVKVSVKSKRYGVKTKLIQGTSAAHTEIGSMVYREYLPEALASGTFVAAPKPRVVGKGLEQIQSAMDCHMRGVSAQKVVVSL